MRKMIIVSSSALYKRLQKLELDGDVEWIFVGVNGFEFVIGNPEALKMDVESRGDFSTTVRRSSIDGLTRVLRVVQDQPIVLEFDSSNFVKILGLSV